MVHYFYLMVRYFLAFSILVLPVFGMSQTSGTLIYSMNTTSTSGYSPKHLVAIWIENSSGTFIKTKMKYSSSSNYDHLATWTGKSAKNLVDAVSGATLTSHGKLTFTWDGTDVSGSQVADGTYYVWVEMAWASSLTTGKIVTSFPFTKGTSTDHRAPADMTNFTAITLDWTPASPNPAISTSALANSSFCAGTAVNVPFTVTGGTYTSGNIFTAQLSNASGSFASPVNIGTLAAVSSGTVIAFIPRSTTTASAYRIRVVASTPVENGTDNGSDLTINSHSAVTITNASGLLTSTATSGNQWYESITGKINRATAQTYSPAATGNFYSIVTDLHSCLDTSNSIHFIYTSISDEFSYNNVSVYPNPSSGIIYIRSGRELSGCRISVQNTAGKVVYEDNSGIVNKTKAINLKGNPNAVYFIILNLEGKELKYKVILK